MRSGKVKEFSNQYIATEFIMFLIPLDSYFIRHPDNGVLTKTVIPMNGVSLRSYYQSVGLMVVPLVLFFSSMIFGFFGRFPAGTPAIVGYVPFMVVLACICYGLYTLYTFGKSDPYELKRRVVLETVMGINAIPEWLSGNDRVNFFNKLVETLPTNWKELIVKEEFDTNLFYRLYTAIYYLKVISRSEEDEALFIKMDKRLNKDLY